MAETSTGYSTDRWDILPNFRFILRVEGYFDVPLKSIRPFSKENEYEYIEEGGMNDYVHVKRKHITKPHTLQVERYITDDFYDPMPNGSPFTLPLLLFVGGNNASDFSWRPSRTYVFFGSLVMNKEIGGFDAEKSGLLTETITISYQQTYSIDTPEIFESAPEAWSFSKGIKNAYANQGMFDLEANKRTRKEFEEAAAENLWEFGEDASEYLGNGIRSAEEDGKKISQNKKTLKQLTTSAKANMWHFGKDASDYLGNGLTHSGSEIVEEAGARPVVNEATGKATVKKTAFELHDSRAKAATWKFGKDADDYQGNKMQHADKLPKGTGSAAKAMTTDERTYYRELAAQKTWRFGKSAGEYTGNGMMSADHITGEEKLSDIMERIKVWPEASYAMQYPWISGTTDAETQEDLLNQ